ncbi:MAG: tetratricopeptide repeat protein [Magnetococcales bacterium]|nr:tetratricopeptide repeat protein [Magnetococcales bacterium]
MVLDFFSFLAPAGIPLLYINSYKKYFPQPIAALSSSEWQRLIAVLDDNRLVILTKSELCLMPEVQAITRKNFDDITTKKWIKAGVLFVSSVANSEKEERLDKVNRLAWHIAVLARWAIKADLREQMGMLLKLLDKAGRKAINIWPDRAIISHLQGIEISEILYGKEHHGVAIRINNLGQAWHRLGELTLAQAQLTKALTMLEKQPGDQQQLIANLLGNIALLRRDQKQIDDASTYFQKALAMVEHKHGLEHPLVNICVNGLGRIIKANQGPKVAIDFIGNVLAKSVRASGVKDHPNIAAVFCNLGILQAETGEKGLARRSLLIANKMAKKTLPKKHPLHNQIEKNLKPLVDSDS